MDALKVVEPEAVAMRKKGKYKRKQYVTAGCNETWTMDQHDKFLKYGIAIHVCVEPFSGYVIWAKAWHTNKNPKVVAGWYLEAVRKLGGMLLLNTRIGSAFLTEQKGYPCTHRVIQARRISGWLTCTLSFAKRLILL